MIPSSPMVLFYFVGSPLSVQLVISTFFYPLVLFQPKKSSPDREYWPDEVFCCFGQGVSAVNPPGYLYMCYHTTTITIIIAFIATTQQISYNIDHHVLKPESQCSPKKRRCLCLELVEVIFEHSLRPIFILAKSFSSSAHNYSYLITNAFKSS